MPRRLITIFIISLLATTTSNAASITAYVNKQFDYVNAGMPSSLEIGQDVNHTFVINQNTTGSPISSGIFYENAITDFEFAIPAVGFHFSGGHGDITHYNDGSLLLTGYAPYSVSLDGQRFASSEIFLIPKADTPQPVGSALQSLRAFEYDGFELNFYHPYSGGSSSGSLVVYGTHYETVGGLYTGTTTPPLTVSAGTVSISGVFPQFDLYNHLFPVVSNAALITVGAAALPEPSASVLLLLAILAPVFRRTRSRR
ncbi:MAG: hypothetical protein AAF591_04315 [Verrucomicrobiota bacterium]